MHYLIKKTTFHILLPSTEPVIQYLFTILRTVLLCGTLDAEHFFSQLLGTFFPLQILWTLLQMSTLHATKYISQNVTECMYHVPSLVTQRLYEPTHLRKHTSHIPMLGDINGGSVCANTYYGAVMTYIPIYYEYLNHIINNTHVYTWLENKVHKLATVYLLWQHWTKALV